MVRVYFVSLPLLCIGLSKLCVCNVWIGEMELSNRPTPEAGNPVARQPDQTRRYEIW
jgi:hypothetical protein